MEICLTIGAADCETGSTAMFVWSLCLHVTGVGKVFMLACDGVAAGKRKGKKELRLPPRQRPRHKRALRRAASRLETPSGGCVCDRRRCHVFSVVLFLFL